MVTFRRVRKFDGGAVRCICVTQPDEPLPIITTAQLEAVRGAAADYIYECADEPPMTETEQMLSLAVGEVLPTSVREQFGDSDQAKLAWVVATCCFVRLAHPDNPRRAAPALYALLDDIEMAAPATWAETYSVVDQLLRQGDLGMDDEAAE